MTLAPDLTVVAVPPAARVFSAQFEFFNSNPRLTSANPLEDYAGALPTRPSALSAHRDRPWPASPTAVVAEAEAIHHQNQLPVQLEAVSPSNPTPTARPFNLQFAEADPFRAGRPLQLTGNYDPAAQQWTFADSAKLPGWSWIGGYDTVVCSRDVVVSQVSKEWCSAGGQTDVQWDEWLEDVVQPDQDMP